MAGTRQANMASMRGPARAPWLRLVTIPTGRRKPMADIAASRTSAAQAHKAGRPRGWRSNRFERLAAWDRPRARTCSRKPCSRHFRDSSPHDAASRKRCKRSLAVQLRQKPCGNKGRQVRSLIPLPFAEMKRIAPDLDEIIALQCPDARGRAGNKYRPVRADKRLRAAHFNRPVQGEN